MCIEIQTYFVAFFFTIQERITGFILYALLYLVKENTFIMKQSE